MFRRALTTGTAAAVAAAATTTTTTATRSLTYTPRVRDFQFLFEDVLDMYPHYERLQGKEAENLATKELVDTLLDESSKLSTQTLFPLYTNEEGCTLTPDGVVKTPKGFKEAYQAYVDGGWGAISEPAQYGGQDLPPSIGFATREIMSTANWSFGMYPGLSAGAVRTVLTWASEELKATYLHHLVSGRWSGTMCLTEPQCGTDLAQVKTKAEPHGDGTYRISGTKIFISAGDHDLTENIIHVVLARLPDSKPGTKGLSLFLVPRNLVQADGGLSPAKNVQCIALEHKMGIHNNATCQLQFDGSVGFLIGEPGDGMKEMFTFMNSARVGTALQGVSHAELAFQNALRYARERGSMRALSGTKAADSPNDPIIYHANVRHNILFAKAVAEGGRCLLTDIGRLLDLQAAAKDKKTYEELDNEIGFYTPIAKGCLTEWGLEAASRCVQVWGGHGYIKGNGMEQILRDARIATLYEGTTGVQAMDFIGRKVLSTKGGNQAKRFARRVDALTRPLIFRRGPQAVQGRLLWLMNKHWRISTARIALSAKNNLDVVGAASEDFLMYSGYLALGYYWLRMSIAAQRAIHAGKDVDGFYRAKVDTCNYVFERVLPRADSHWRVMTGSAELCKSDQQLWDIAS